jgi:NADH-quinone oxidoreductase subunit L
VKWTPFGVMLTGLVVAYLAYMRPTRWPERFTAQWRVLHDFLLHKWYFDELYDLLFVRPAFWIGRLLWKGGDQGTIDRFGPNGLAALVVQGGKVTKRLQSGFLYSYALVMLIGLAAAASWAITYK